jgi:hypothetical protein
MLDEHATIRAAITIIGHARRNQARHPEPPVPYSAGAPTTSPATPARRRRPANTRRITA